jgi:glyoxylase-like metal-dependent hydrolase (beta-lactamase superfamily II)
MASAHMVYGDELDALFGRLAPPRPGASAPSTTSAISTWAAARPDSHYSPGHAKHHVGLIDSVSGDLYVGDAAGVYIQETGDMRPATPPPDFDLETALASLRTFKSLRPQRLLFSHFGPVSAVGETLERSAEEIRLWVDETKRAVGSGLGLDHAAAMVAERTRDRYAVLRDDADPLLAANFERVAGAVPNVAGIMHWLDKTPGA